MCLQNLTIQHQVGTFVKLDGEFNRSYDNDTGRHQWTNLRDDTQRWYYRVNTGENNVETYNWVLEQGNADRVACAPGYVEMPLYCTTFVYAGRDNNTSLNPDLSKDHLGLVTPEDATDTDTTWKLGGCAETSSPTMEPTREPTTIPTVEPTAKPTVTPRCPKDYIFSAVDEDTTVTMDCPFGWMGTEIERYCQEGGTWTTVSDDCALLS